MRIKLTMSLRRILPAMLFAGLLPMMAPVVQADTLDKVLTEKKLTVGYIPYDELTYRDLETGKISGFFPDLIEAIAAGMGIKPEDISYEATDWANFAVGLQAGKYDLSISGTFSTIPRATAAAFTRPIFYLGNSAVIRKGDARFAGMTDVMELDRADLTIAVVSGEQSQEFVKRNFKNAKIKIVKSADLTTAMLEVTAKRADVAMSDHYVVKSFVAGHPETEDLFASHPWNIQPIAWAVRKEDQRLLNFMNTALEYMDSTGTMEKLMRAEKYRKVPFMKPVMKLQTVQ